MGLPVVVSDATAAREHVADGQNGLWFPVDDVDALAAKLGSLACDNALVERLGRAANEYFWAHPRRFDVDRHIDALERIYEKIVEGGAAR